MTKKCYYSIDVDDEEIEILKQVLMQFLERTRAYKRGISLFDKAKSVLEIVLKQMGEDIPTYLCSYEGE